MFSFKGIGIAAISINSKKESNIPLYKRGYRTEIWLCKTLSSVNRKMNYLTLTI